MRLKNLALILLGLVPLLLIPLVAHADIGDLLSVEDETKTYKFRIESNADINSGNQGGFKMAFDFLTPDATTSTTEFLLRMVPDLGQNSATTVKKISMPFSGSIIAITVWASGTPTAGALTFEPFINGVATGLTASWTSGRISGEEVASQVKDLDTFSARDTVSVQMRSDANLAPDLSLDVVATLIVEM